MRCEGACSDTAIPVDFHNFALLWLQNISGRFQSQLFDNLAQNFLRRGVNQKAIIKHDAERIIANHEPDRIVLIQYRKHKRTLDLLSHGLQAAEVEGFIFL